MITTKKQFSFFLMLFLSTLISSCTSQKSQWLNKAPQEIKDLGVLVRGVSAVDLNSFLHSHPTAQARLLYQPQGLYEIYGVEKQVIDKELSPSDLEKNILFKLNSADPFFEIKKRLFTSDHELSQLCGNTPNSQDLPKVSVNNENNPNSPVPSSMTIDINEQINFIGKSSSDSTFNSPLEEYWYLLPSKNSQLKPSLFKSTSIQFLPDALGPYTFAFIARDKRKICSHPFIFQVGVTKNQPFESIPLSKLQVFLDFFKNNLSFRKSFFHLDQIKAEESWKLSTGKGVKIALLDSGVFYNHPALNKNIFINSLEIPYDQIDNDQNGFIDDTNGYDLIQGDPYPFDDHGHGTHIAGLAASPVFGIAKEAELIPIKVMSTFGFGDLGSIVAGIYYATDLGARIINMSFGDYASDPENNPLFSSLRDAIRFAESKGVLVVAAAGNGEDYKSSPINTDESPVVPASLINNNILSVAATDGLNKMASYSNYGASSVDIAAPGGGNRPETQILSTAMENETETFFTRFSGTSMATALVSGVAAQIVSVHPELKAHEVKNLIMIHSTPFLFLKNKVQSEGHLNALESIKKSSTP